MAGSSANCRAFRCCNVDYTNGQIFWQIKDEDIANPFGHRGCDMPINGTKAILQELAIKLEAVNYEAASLIIVTGNVVT